MSSARNDRAQLIFRVQVMGTSWGRDRGCIRKVGLLVSPYVFKVLDSGLSGNRKHYIRLFFLSKNCAIGLCLRQNVLG